MRLAFRPAFMALGFIAALAGFYTFYSGIAALRQGEPGAGLLLAYGLVALGIGVGLVSWARRSRQG